MHVPERVRPGGLLQIFSCRGAAGWRRYSGALGAAPPAFRSWDVSDRALYAVRQGADGARHLHRYCTKLAPSGRTSGVDAIRSSPQTLSTRRSPSVAAAPPTLMSKFPMISIAEANETSLRELLDNYLSLIFNIIDYFNAFNMNYYYFCI